MKITNFFAVSAAAILLTAGATAAQAGTYTNAPNSGNIGSFGSPDSQTYGEVFTAQETGSLTSFTMYLNGAIGGTLYGGIGVWNGSPTFNFGGGTSSIAYQSAQVAANHSGAYTFAPNVNLTAGNTYVAFLSVFGANNAGQGATTMPLGSGGGGFDYFVWNNSNGGPASSSWNYFGNFGNGRLDLTFAAAPEPMTWAFMLVGFGGMGALLRRRRMAVA
jgi:hypothetical protein